MPPRNPYICLAIVVAMAATVHVGLLGILVLAYEGRETPTSVISIISVAIGSLSSFLVSVPRGSAGSDSASPPR